MIAQSQQIKQPSRKQVRQEGSYIQFQFPKSKQGIEFVESKKLLSKILRDMFYVQFTSKGSSMPYPYQIVKKPLIRTVTETRSYTFIVKCRICTNFLEYTKRLDGESEMYKLQTFYSEHDHRLNQQRKVGYSHEKVNLDYRTAKLKKVFLNLNKYSSSTEDIEKCIAELPVNLTKKLRETIVCRKFNLSINQFKNIYLKLNSRKEIEFAEFVDDLQKKGYQYRYLPENLLKDNPKFSRKYHPTSFFSSNLPTENKQMPTMTPRISIDSKKPANPFHDPKDPRSKSNPATTQAFAINPQPNIVQESQTKNTNPNIPMYKLNPHTVDPNNPNLPNVLLIVSPGMREMYRKYGQFMGFDLTFSLIRQQPTHTQKEYLVGVFASKSESLRIIIFGLVITNNQSAEVYKWCFKNFMQIMGKQPQTIITDEQVAIGKAIRQLKEEGFYHGHHLLDTFHVLTKFRKAVESNTFQYLRKMIHAKDKFEYKRLFEETLAQLSSDDEIKVLQDFDYHCEKYCYAHIPATFVGFGVSDAMNQSFHNILKDKIPYEIKYLKACNIILPFLQQRNELGKLSLVCEIPYENKFKFEYLKPYRKLVSDRVFGYLIVECSKGITHSLVLSDERYEKNEVQKIEEGGRSKEEGHYELNRALDKDKFQIVTKEGICLVWKQKIHVITTPKDQMQVTCDPSNSYWSQYPLTSTYTTNFYPFSQSEPQFPSQQYKWRCVCQMQEKSGLCCSHILKLLILKNESLLPYIHPRWYVNEDSIYQGLGTFIKNQAKAKDSYNITTDLSNLNRMKSIKLRGQYIHARKTIKKELEGIVQENLDPEPQIVPQDVRVRKQLLSSIRNKPNPSLNPQHPMRSSYLEWVSANDDTIQKQKKKHRQVLESKRRKYLKWLRKQAGCETVPKKGQKQKYVEYVYLNRGRQIVYGKTEKLKRKNVRKNQDSKRQQNKRVSVSIGDRKSEMQKGENGGQRKDVEEKKRREQGQDGEDMQEIVDEEEESEDENSQEGQCANGSQQSQMQPEQQIIDEMQQLLNIQKTRYQQEEADIWERQDCKGIQLDQEVEQMSGQPSSEQNRQPSSQQNRRPSSQQNRNLQSIQIEVENQQTANNQGNNPSQKTVDDAFDDYFERIYSSQAKGIVNNVDRTTKHQAKYHPNPPSSNVSPHNSFENQYSASLSSDLHQPVSNDYTTTNPSHKPLQKLSSSKSHLYNPFSKSIKQQLIEHDHVLPPQSNTNHRDDSDDDFDPKTSKKKPAQAKEGNRKRGRPRIRPIVEQRQRGQSKKRGRPPGAKRSPVPGKISTSYTREDMEMYMKFYGYQPEQDGKGSGEEVEEDES